MHPGIEVPTYLLDCDTGSRVDEDGFSRRLKKKERKRREDELR